MKNEHCGQESRQLIIAAVGDSLTAGFGVAPSASYPSRLERKLREEGILCRLINAGINGEKSGELLARIEDILSWEPDIVILQTGTNDGLRNVKPKEMKENIRQAVRSFKDRGITVVLAGMKNLKSRKGDFDGIFAAAYPEIAREEDVILVPFFLEGVAGMAGLNRGDGIHPTEEGYRIVVENVYPRVLEAIDKAR
jgi:acyl-CoA thioesterase-1